MRIVHGAVALLIGMMACTTAAQAFSAIGLRNSLQNCLDRDISPPDRIEACNQVIHTNILLQHDQARVIASRGNAYFVSGNLDKAFDDYNKAFELNARLPPAIVNRGLAYTRLGKCDQAISDFNTALSLDAHLWQALYGRNLCEAKAGDKAKAQADLAAATAIEPNAAQQFAPMEITRWYQ